MLVTRNDGPVVDTGTGLYSDTLEVEHTDDFGNEGTGAVAGPSEPETYTSDDPTGVAAVIVEGPGVTVHYEWPDQPPKSEAPAKKTASKKK